MRSLCVLLLPVMLQAGSHSFKVDRSSEVVAELDLKSARSDWSVPGREAAIARMQVDGKAEQHLVVFGHERKYRVFLGRLEPGKHSLSIERDPQLSARGSDLKVSGVKFEVLKPGQEMYPIVANAPILYGRQGATEAFSDVPILMYCERFSAENGAVDLQYTIIFSNEDGGTSTRALMARWGRTTDIEYVYRVRLNGQGGIERAAFQGKDHKEIDYSGEREGDHPKLLVSTLNNMVVDQGTSNVRYQLAPSLYDLGSSSREKTMDDRAILYRIAAEELTRENKLRPYGTIDGQKISDPRNYAIIEAQVKRKDASVAFLIKLKEQPEVFRSDLGRADYGIARDGWIRSATELPPGTNADQIESVAMECVGDPVKAGSCEVAAGLRIFVLGREYIPAAITGLNTKIAVAAVGGNAIVAHR